MKKQLLFPLVFLVLTGITFSGCQRSPKASAPVKPTVSAPVLGSAPVVAYQAGGTPDQTRVPRPMSIGDEPLAVRSQDQIVEIELEPYIDENGNAFGPQKKYMIAKTGEWNRAALRNPNSSYIPAVNLEPIPGPGVYTPYLSPGSALEKTSGAKSIAQLYDVKDVTVTGLVERSQGPQAQQIAAANGDDLIPVFDESLGWILLPKRALVAGAAQLGDGN